MYCPSQDASKATKTLEQQALRLLTHETQYQVLEVRDPELAKFVKMEPGKFYCYYKPTFVNGFASDPQGNPMQNKEALQVLEGICRDELTIRADKMARLNANLLVTEQLTNTVFDQVFSSTSNVQFSLNPNMRAFKRRVRSPTGDRPILFIH